MAAAWYWFDIHLDMQCSTLMLDVHTTADISQTIILTYFYHVSLSHLIEHHKSSQEWTDIESAIEIVSMPSADQEPHPTDIFSSRIQICWKQQFPNFKISIK